MKNDLVKVGDKVRIIETGYEPNLIGKVFVVNKSGLDYKGVPYISIVNGGIRVDLYRYLDEKWELVDENTTDDIQNLQNIFDNMEKLMVDFSKVLSDLKTNKGE